MTKKNKIIVSIVGITIVLLALLGLTYAYYLTRIEGNTNTNSISLTTADLRLVYRDGNGAISKENIMPGTIIEKTFTVENTGNNKVDNYAVYLEEIVNTLSRTEDLTYVLECTSTGVDCDGGSGEFPTLATDIATNSIETGVTHSYKLTVTYVNHETIDQSIDMGSEMSGFIQIYAMKDILDIEGTITGASEGDYAQINSVQKRSQIVNGKYKFAGVLPGTHTLKVCSKEDTVCSNETAKLSEQIVVNVGTSAGVSGNTITMTETSQTATINMNVSSGNIEIDSTIKEMEISPFPKGTLAYAILNNAKNPKDINSTIFSETPLTTPGVKKNDENERTLSITEDDYGNSYYYRGNVIDNYVNYSGMCWRIVRIQGNGTVKLVLADENGECNAPSYSLNNSVSAFVDGRIDVEYGIDIAEHAYFENSNIPSVLSKWATDNSLDMSKLVDAEWCNDTSIKRKEYGFRVGEDDEDFIEVFDDDTDALYKDRDDILEYWYSYTGWYEKNNASLLCNSKGIGSEATIYVNKLGLLTANELMLAGLTKDNNTSIYLYPNAHEKFYNHWNEYDEYNQWTMTPGGYFYDGYDDSLSIIVIKTYDVYEEKDGYFLGSNAYATSNGAVRPSIVLRKDVLVTIDTTSQYEAGTYQNPYVIRE